MATASLELIRGDTWRLPFTWKDSAGVAIDLTGAAISWQMRTDVDGTVIAAASLADGTISTGSDPSAGNATVQIPYAGTESIAPGAYWHDMQITFADGTRMSTPKVRAVVMGDITID